MKKVDYDKYLPLARLEKGDRAIISVNHFDKSIVKEKDIKKYKDVPNGKYEAICIEPYHLKCEEYPILSGKYCYWGGNRWGCSDGIFADEPLDTKESRF